MKFVIAVDGSKPSETAFTYVLGLAEKKVDEVCLDLMMMMMKMKKKAKHFFSPPHSVSFISLKILLATSLVEKKGLLTKSVSMKMNCTIW